jgi:hypothetical protein
MVKSPGTMVHCRKPGVTREICIGKLGPWVFRKEDQEDQTRARGSERREEGREREEYERKKEEGRVANIRFFYVRRWFEEDDSKRTDKEKKKGRKGEGNWWGEKRERKGEDKDI